MILSAQHHLGQQHGAVGLDVGGRSPGCGSLGLFFVSGRRRHTSLTCDWSSDVCSSDLHFTHSKVIAWLAFDRAVRYHDEFGREGPFERWRAIRDEIHAEVCDRAWCEEKQAFAQSYRSKEGRVGKECRSGGGSDEENEKT